MDAHDQKTMDKLYGACETREQWTYDVGSDVMAEFGRTAEAERGRKAGGTGQRTNKMVGWGIVKNERSSKKGGEVREAASNRIAWQEQAEIFAELDQGRRHGQ